MQYSAQVLDQLWQLNDLLPAASEGASDGEAPGYVYAHLHGYVVSFTGLAEDGNAPGVGVQQDVQSALASQFLGV